MANTPLTLDEALKQYDRETDKEDVMLAEQERQEIVKLFPLDSWPTLPLSRYALGQNNKEDCFCWWMEFGAAHAGSIKGGSAAKHIIYRQRDSEWFFDRQQYKNEQEAWETVRNGFMKAFQQAKNNEWATIDQIQGIDSGPALRTKALYCYFPQDILPVYSMAHLRHFIKLIGGDQPDLGGYNTVRTNRILLESLRKMPQLKSWNTKEIERFLYYWANPHEQHRIVKIAPGENAKYWQECLTGGYVCLGWSKIGDLREYQSKEAFEIAFSEAYADRYGGKKAAITKKGRELWTARELEAGDLVVANQGISRVLAVGEVVEPCYEYAQERSEYRHIVHVKWDTSYEKTIPPQKRWGLVTVADVPQELAALILSGDDKRPVVDPLYREIADALERKGQVILYGPPGTGKTYTARRFAVWWLSKQEGNESPAILTNSSAFKEAERNLSTAQAIGSLTRLTFHASYSYEDFIEGYRPVDNKDGHLVLRLEDGIFKRICREAQANPNKPYLILIDEINRANVAKVLGELITLLEKDKRGLLISLPQSKEAFAIPSNVYLLGTMNTADRSIKLLDSALRRRFAFLELMPNSSLLEGSRIGTLQLNEFLDKLNERIAAKEGREKQIGHSFLMEGGDPITEIEEFARRFRQEILPLLQEYCYDDYRVLAEYIGNELVDQNGQTLNGDRLSDPDSLIKALDKAFADKDSTS